MIEVILVRFATRRRSDWRGIGPVQRRLALRALGVVVVVVVVVVHRWLAEVAGVEVHPLERISIASPFSIVGEV